MKNMILGDLNRESLGVAMRLKMLREFPARSRLTDRTCRREQPPRTTLTFSWPFLAEFRCESPKPSYVNLGACAPEIVVSEPLYRHTNLLITHRYIRVGNYPIRLPAPVAPLERYRAVYTGALT
jgi:hypothetical protein